MGGYGYWQIYGIEKLVRDLRGTRSLSTKRNHAEVIVAQRHVGKNR